MQTHNIDTQESKHKAFALYDRRMRNIANASHYTEQQRVRAERMRMALTLCYAGVVYEPSYGTTGISIKVTGLVRDRQVLKSLEAAWDTEGVIKKASAQGVLYRFKK